LALDEFPGHVETVEWNPMPERDKPDLGSKPLEDNDVTIIEKSNLLLLGPSGVGKTYSKPTSSYLHSHENFRGKPSLSPVSHLTLRPR